MARGEEKPQAKAGLSNPTGDVPFPAEAVADRLLDWYDAHGRDLPWRRTRDPYRIWLSEIMLQQTTVAAVIPYYQKFLERFPTLEALAAGSLDEVLRLWAGLGYYSRARNLHRAARQVMAEFSGRFPETPEALISLPGIGRSTAGAIRAIAFDHPAAILDGNVRRVLVRLFAWTDDPRSSRAERQLWQWAELLTPAARAHDYSQAIMDLGAMVCVPGQPLCDRCPLNGLCLAHRQGLAGKLPVRRIKKAVPRRHQAALLVRLQDRLLVSRRPPDGLLGGLWEFPVVDLAKSHPGENEIHMLQNDLGLPGNPEHIGTIHHAYSHFKLVLEVYSLRLADLSLIADSDRAWCPVEDLQHLPLHGAHEKALAIFLEAAKRE